MKVDIIKQETVELEEYWVIRGIAYKGIKKEVVAELEIEAEPNSFGIAQFLIDNPRADFCSVEHNYRLKKDGVEDAD